MKGKQLALASHVTQCLNLRLRGTTMKEYVSAPAIALAAMLFGGIAAIAHADTGDTMYAVGSDIQPGTYRYTVTAQAGDWHLCRDANCEDEIALDAVEGYGHTGYLTVPPTARYLKTWNLTLTPMH
jgi:hypothetical protein